MRLHFADGATAIATDHVILMMSLGILMACLGKDAHAMGRVAFDPPLPQFKRDAVARLGFGVVDKLSRTPATAFSALLSAPDPPGLL